MNSRRSYTLALSLAILAATCTSPVRASAATLPVLSPMHAFFANSGNVKFTVRNASTASITLRCGETTMTIDAGKSLSVNLPAGAKIVTAEATAARPAGDLVAEVSSNLKNTTIVLR